MLKSLRLKKLGVNFFDAEKVLAAKDRAEVRVHMRAGGLIRKVARRSIRKRKGASQPGRPPSSHSPHPLRNLIFFAPDSRGGVVIGPALFRSSKSSGITASDTVPKTLESGGSIRITEYAYKGGWQAERYVPRSQRGKLKRRVRVQRILPRPYMGPALRSKRGEVTKMWHDSIKGV